VDTARYKHAPPILITLPSGDTAELRPLTPTEIERAKLAADALINLHRAPRKGGNYLLEQICQHLSTATGIPAESIRAELHVGEALTLFKLWRRHHESCQPDLAKLKLHLRKRVNDDPDVMKDGVFAHLAKDATDYFGVPMVDLTEGQVAYWQLLAAAYDEFHVPDSKGRLKQATKSWLKKNE
jgi:hypothetical protein